MTTATAWLISGTVIAAAVFFLLSWLDVRRERRRLDEQQRRIRAIIEGDRQRTEHPE